MFKRLILLGVILAAAAVLAQPHLLINSSHTHNTFQLTLSLAPDISLGIYSKKIVRNSDHWVHIDTHYSPAAITPPFPANLMLVNAYHEGRHVLKYYEKSVSTDLNRHFHYMAVREGDATYGLLLPSYSEPVPAFRTDRIYRCRNTIISVEWYDQSAHIVVFSQEDPWHIRESIDGGFRSDERGLYYGYAIDHGHVHAIKVHIGDHDYCKIDPKTPPAAIDFKWEVRENYDINDILYIAGESLPVYGRSTSSEEL